MEGQEFLIPKEGLLIRDPKTMKPLPKKGAMKFTKGVSGRYWRRRISDGSVIIGKRAVKQNKPSLSESNIKSNTKSRTRKQNKEE